MSENFLIDWVDFLIKPMVDLLIKKNLDFNYENLVSIKEGADRNLLSI